MPTIPKHAGEISAAWLTDVLCSRGATTATVTDIVLEQLGAGVGIMGELYRVDLSYEPGGEGPSSVVVKLPSPYETNRQQGVDLGVYEAEIRFYQELADATPVRTPVCYFADIVSGTSEFVMVMEDLSALTMASQIEGMTLAQTQQAFDALVALHLAWWGRVDTPEVAWVPSVVHARIKAFAGMWPDLWPMFVSKFGDTLPVGAIAAGEEISRNYWPLMQHLGRQPWTLLHQDFRVENLFFDPGRGDVVVYDWQTLGRGPGPYDLAYLLGGSMVSEQRRANERDLVRDYHRRLLAAGIEDYSYDDLWRDYRIGQLVNTATPVLGGAIMDLANERGTELIATLGRRHFTAVVELDAVDLISSIV